MQRSVERISAGVARGRLSDGVRSAPSASVVETADHVELLVAGGWPGPDPAEDVMEYVLTLRLDARGARLEVFVGTDQGELLLPMRTIRRAPDEPWVDAFEAWLEAEVDDEEASAALRRALARQAAGEQ